MPVIVIDPLRDSRWKELVERDPRASVFHTVGWLQALHDTYGYTPMAFTTATPGETLRSGAVFCEVKSWITGRRLVSLPFSDHCGLLAENGADAAEILRAHRTAGSR